MNRSTLSVLAILTLSGSALADDLFPPSWRFNPGTTVQHWDFSAGAGGGLPDALPLNNPYGTPNMVPPPPANFFPTFNGRNDVWSLSTGAGLNFDIPNTGVATHQKELWLQVTFFALAPGGPPGVTVGSTAGPFTQTASQITPLGNGWFHELSKWSTPICPLQERVAITPSLAGTVVFIDQVVIDTQCFPVPAPAASAPLALAGLLALRRRR